MSLSDRQRDCFAWPVGKRFCRRYDAPMLKGDWQLDELFPAIDSELYQRYIIEAQEQLDILAHADAWKTNISELANQLLALETAAAQIDRLQTYIGCRMAADTKDNTAALEWDKLGGLSSRLHLVQSLAGAQLASLSDETFEGLCQEHLTEQGHHLRRLRTTASWSLAEQQEVLVSDLGQPGFIAWSNLYNEISGQLTFQMEKDGKIQTLPVSSARSYLSHSDRHIRKSAFTEANRAWQSSALPIASSLNAIADYRLKLYKRRGIKHFIEPALHDAGIQRQTLDAMLTAVRSKQAVARQYLKDKAKLLGIPKLAFWDLVAPVGTPSPLTWQQCQDQILDAFSRYSSKLTDFSKDAFDKQWIDYTVRANKRPGGFCSSSSDAQTSRIFLTFNGTLPDAQVVAHELGHAFHSLVLRERSHWAHKYPMPLAETASTFCEQLVITHLLESSDLSNDERLSVVGAQLDAAATFILNIPMRFDFEHALYETRRQKRLSVSDLCDVVLSVQRSNYGDALDKNGLDPWFWASKLHFYMTHTSFYNFPYTFGYLFSLSLFSLFQKQGADFVPLYEELLRNTATMSPEELVHSLLGEDITEPEFWLRPLDMVASDMQGFTA